MKAPALSLLALMALSASGCQTASTDPREGGLMGGITGLQSGAYDERVRERQDRLAEMRALQGELDSERSDLDGRRAALQREVAEERSRLARLGRDIAGLDSSVAELSARRGSDDARVEALQRRIVELKAQAGRQQRTLDALEGSGVGGTDLDLRRRQLEEQRRALQREYELLMQLSLELAR